MADQKIGVSLEFKADTTQAQRKMVDLQHSLTKVMQTTSKDLPGTQLTNQLDQATVAAARLKVQLESAFNQKTGKLDLTKFDQQLRKSGMTLEKYRQALMAAGPAGQQAFNQLATAVASAEIPIIRISERMQKLGQTFANTIRWKISNVALEAILGTFTQAYQYAEDLNESLNNIRIVTGKSTIEMDKFAEKANKAAKVLSTTTTKYTDASLIYFQQGLSEKEVQKRTDLTIKMANVTGQSVAEVSDQLTAVWNNFDKGGENLEKYVDIMVALGAATASSAEEISEGLNKFAATAETVGLSYEYAATALATVTSVTRESADVVGTAFKTLFARIQDLELGKTLDDGTTLGKYSEALAAVGINIKDINGNVKDMNTILDEMGAKWNTLNKDTQIALAQNVAGVRQYTQLIALMDNWSVFQNNLNTATSSSGALNEQAEIYAEGWEAARKHVTASLEAIYKKLIDDDAFIDILNFFADLIEGVDKLIDSFGGLKGILTVVASAFLTFNQQAIASGLQTAGNTVASWTKTGRARLNERRNEALNAVTSNIDTSTTSGALQKELTQDLIQLERDYQEAVAGATAEHKEMGRVLKENVLHQAKEVEEAIKLNQEAEAAASTSSFRMKKNFISKGSEDVKDSYSAYVQGSRQNAAASVLLDELALGREDAYYQPLNAVFQEGRVDDKSLDEASVAIDNISTKLNNLDLDSDETREKLKAIFGEDVIAAVELYKKSIEEAKTKLAELKGLAESDRKIGKGQGLTDKEQERKAKLIERKKANEEIVAAPPKNSKKAKRAKGIAQTELKELEELEKKEAEALFSASEKMEKALEGQQDATQKAGKAVSDYAATVEGGTEALEQDIVAQEGAGAAAGQATVKLKGLTGAVKENGQNIQNAIAQTSGFTDKLVSLSSMAMSAAIALQSIQNLGSIIGDENLTAGEKALQLMMNLGIILPQLTSAFNKQNIAKLFGLTITKAENGDLIINTAQKGANVIVTKLQTAVQWLLNQSMLVYVAVLALVVAAIAFLVVGIVKLISSQEKEVSALEKAKAAYETHSKALEEANERYSEATEHLDSMRTMLEEIAKTQNAFDGLVEGSTAWQENLEKNNEQILELLKLYPELDKLYVNDKKLIDFDERGVYTVADMGALAQYIEGQSQIAQENALISSIIAEQNKARASAEVKFLGSAKERIEQGSLQRVDKETNRAKNTYTLGTQKASFSNSSGASTNWKESETGKLNLYMDAVHEAMQKGKGLDEALAYANEKVPQATDHIKNFVKEGLYSIEELTEAEKELAEARTYESTRWRAAAQSILSTKYGYSELSGQDKELATLLFENKLKDSANKSRFTSADSVNGITQADLNLMASLVLGQKASNTTTNAKWNDGRNASGDSAQADWGDYFARSEEGLKVLQAYLKETQNMEFDKSEANFEVTKVKIGNDELEINYQDILNWAGAKGAIEDINFADFFAEIEKYSDVVVAGVIGNINELTQAEVEELKNYISTGSEELVQLADKFGVTLKELWERASDYDEEIAANYRYEKEIAEANAMLASSAMDLGVEAGALEAYAQATEGLYGSYKEAAKAAVANAKYAQGVKKLSEALEDGNDALLKWKNSGEVTMETAEALNEIITALTKIFGVEVSTDFIKANLDKIQQLNAGGKEAVKALKDLELLAAKDYVVNLNLKEETKSNLEYVLDWFSKQEIKPGMDIDITEIQAQLEQVLKSGEITAEELQKTFGAIHWSPEFKSKPEWTESAVYSYEGVSPGSSTDTDFEGKKYTGQWKKVITKSKIDTFSIGDTLPKFTKLSSPSPGQVGGGGGSGNKNKKTTKKKKVNEEAERYHEIKNELSDLQTVYDRIAKAKDRAFGQKRIDLIGKEKKAVQDLIAGQKAYLDEIKEKFVEDQQVLTKYGASFDSEGRISNYDEMVAVNVKAYNDAVAKRDKGQMTEEDFKKREEAYEQFMKDIAQFEETRELYINESDALTDLKYQLQDLELEEIQVKVDLDISLAEDQIKLLEYQIDNLGNSWTDLQQKMSQFGSKMNAQLAIGQTQEQGIRQILGLGENEELDVQALLGSKDLTDAQVQALREYRDGLWDTNAQLKEMRITIQEELISAFDSWNEEMAEGVETIDHLSSMLQGFRDIIDLVGKDNLGVSDELLKAMNQAKLDGSRNALQVAKATLDSNKQALADAQAQLDKARKENRKADEENWEAVVKSLSATVTAGEEELMTRWSESLQSAADVFGEAVDSIMDTFESAMSGISGSFEELQTKFSQRSEERDRYLADYERVYELSKLSRDINKSIDTSDSARAASKLKDIQEEVYALQQSGAEVTRYEVDEMRARYELRLAEIALEDAQNAKSQVRMRRDGEGNWSYVYTADSDQIDQAAQNVDDKMYALKQVQSARIDELEEQLVNLPQEFANALRTIAEDVTLTEEQRKKKIEETTQYFQGRYQWLGEQLNVVLWDADKDFNDTLYAQITDFSSIEQAQRTFVTATDNMVSGLGSAYQDYLVQVNGIMKDAEFATDEFATKAQKAIARITAESTKAAKNVEDIANKGEEGFAGLVEAAAAEYKNYEKNTQPYIERNKALAESVTQFINEYAKLKVPLNTTAATDALGKVEGALSEIERAAKAAAVALSKVGGSGGGSGTQNWNNGAYDKEYVKKLQEFLNTKYNASISVDGLWGASSAAAAKKANAGYISIQEVAKAYEAWLKLQNKKPSGGGGGGAQGIAYTLLPDDRYNILLTGLDTGGYTGEWGSDGRLALLHQKELVLNADDTSKFLSAIEIVRNIAQVIDLRAAAQQSALAAMSTVQVAPTTQTLQQDVTIHAEFPNATSHSEIEEAFDTLLNRAAQFANRKN